jgi:hypothetical protein
MIEIKQKEKIIIASAVTFLLLIIFVFLVLLPLSDKIGMLKTQVKQGELKLKEVLGLQSKKDYILFECNKYAQYLQTSEASDQENDGWLLKEIERLSQNSYLTVVSLAKADIEINKDFKIYNADLKAEGEMAEVLRFFSYIQEENKLLVVRDFTVAPKDEKATSLEFDAKIAMYIPQIALSEKK